ncbi:MULTISPECIES: Ppx/GppA phosphatase family protein [unclassified Candidatus Frackibacter]|uniref:Ppx/GppA phosphatase family protein n=1 Tax=unclassified Candidatus Frackibacter TaxID=2648818 RepID=UPI0008822E46|nr:MULTISPECIES: Ppx/GppA phosphatase family protein [unclassified Candidatus Frackibacter]SDC66896.1 Ppx/GppA phosphatase [Candidatus Frackibacter sp. WG11]SEM80167.1 Ppx/GppA phosphatase [Candidatus Frackibacter sp. WG12]SFL90697.1 Ppx/GppA phosphatase [Candidatus Frackibacter sp. WG13]
MERLAAIDIGTNSTRLLIGELLLRGEMQPLATELRTTRLGKGVDSSQCLQPEAIERTIKALSEYRRLLDDYQVNKFRVVATSAVRDAVNRQLFIDKVNERTGLNVEVISGEEEAELSYLGVVKGLSDQLLDSNLVLDIGGGSTEFILGVKDKIKERFSIDVGAVRMTEKSSDIEQRSEMISSLITPVIKKIDDNLECLLGVGGTITTLAAIDQSLSSYDPKKVHGYALDISTIKEILLKLNTKSITERKAVIGLQPKRADIIVAGIQILLEIMKRMRKKKIIVSESDILEGIIYDYSKKKKTKVKESNKGI